MKKIRLIFRIFVISGFAISMMFCGKEIADKKPAVVVEPSEKVPSNWDGNSDWVDSEWRVIEE